MHEAGSLKKKTLSGLVWSFSDLIANQVIQFIIQITLARLLLPKDFGIIGMITIFIAISNSVIDSGFSNALIRENKPNQDDYSTVFYFNLIMAFIMYAVLFLSADFISAFFKEPQLVFILRVLSLTLIINSFGLIQRTMLIKNIDFKTQTRISVISSIISGVVAIIFAYMGCGVWSLVIRTLSMQFIQSFLLCLFNKWMPSLVFKIDSFKRLFGFGWKLLVSGLLYTLYDNLYFIIIGRGFSTLELGYYTNTSRLRDIASQAITFSVQRVSYPVLSSMQEDNAKLKIVYKKIIKTSVFITFPMMIGLAAVASPLITLLFGYKWIPSIYYFEILCFAGMLAPLHAINLNILKVKGRSDLFLGLEIVKVVIGLTTIAVVMFWGLGIKGLLWAAVFNSFISYFVNSFFSVKLLDYSTKEQIKDVMPSFIASIFMGITVYFSGLFLPTNYIIKLIAEIIIGCLSYIGISKIAKIEELNIVYDLIGLLLKKIRLHQV